MTVPPFTPAEYRALVRLVSDKVAEPRSHPRWADLRAKMNAPPIQRAMTGETT